MSLILNIYFLLERKLENRSNMNTISLYICSLFRTPNLEEAELRFITFKDRIPPFIEVAKEVSFNDSNNISNYSNKY